MWYYHKQGNDHDMSHSHFLGAPYWQKSNLHCCTNYGNNTITDAKLQKYVMCFSNLFEILLIIFDNLHICNSNDTTNSE